MKLFNLPVFALSLAFFLSQGLIVHGQGQPSASPTHRDVSYGDHSRNVLNFWQAPGDGPRPLLVFIHGGGWTQGNMPGSARQFIPFLERGISVAAINYRLSSDEPLPAPVHDAARAIQYLRSQARALNIDTNRIAVTGGSAGGCTAMWLLFREDMADPSSPDPVLRESTRVIAAAVSNAQASIDPKVVAEWVGPQILRHRMIWTAVGEPDMASALENYEEHRETYAEFSPYNHVSPGDPPLLMTYSHGMALPAVNANHAIHHPVFGVKMRQKALGYGNEMHLLVDDGPRYSDYDTPTDFLIGKLLEEQ